MTKIDIFSGFLGAGKTTLIKKLIKEAYVGEKLVLIENEFGEIGIDGGFMKEAGIQVNEMNSGCICCSLVGDFTASLRQVLEQYAPDRVLIEPSGVGKLSDVIKAAKQAENDSVKLNSFTVIADAAKCKVYSKNFGEFYNDQLENANCVVLSRTDNISKEKLDAALDIVRHKNPNATIVTTPWGQVGGKQILEAMEQRRTLRHEMEGLQDNHLEHHHHHDGDCHCHEHHHDQECHDHEHHHHHHGGDCHCHEHHHRADDVFASWGVETVNAYTKQEITDALQQLANEEKYGVVLRAKGIVAGIEGEWIHFDYVPNEINVRIGGADVIGRVCVIGSAVSEEALQELFRI